MKKKKDMPTHLLLTPKQLELYKKFVGNPPKGVIVARGYHDWVADGDGGVKIKDLEKGNR